MKNNTAKILFGIVIIALFLRLSAVFNQKEADRIPKRDAAGYDEMAANLASGKGLTQLIDGSLKPVIYRTPGYPLFLAGIYYISGHNYMTAKIVQAVLGALFCIIVFFIANLIHDDAMTGLTASLCAALYKPFISGFYFYGGPASLYSEYFCMFIIGLAILALLFFIKKGGAKTGMLAGLFMGLAVLTRSEFAVFPVILIIYLFCVSKLSIKALLKKYFIVYFFMVLAIIPWTARNYIVFKEFIPLSTNGGISFWGGNNSLANGGESDPAWSWKDGTTKKDKEYFRKGMEYLKNNPKRIPALFTRKILVHWAPFAEGFRLFNSFYAFILLFGGIGILFFRKKSVLENILLLILVTTTVSAVITYGEPRYRYSYEPYLIIFSTPALIGIIRKVRR